MDSNTPARLVLLSGRRHGVTVSENTPMARENISERSDSQLHSRRLESDDGVSVGELGTPVRPDSLDSQGRVISQLVGNSTKLLSQIGSLSTVGGGNASPEGDVMTMEGVSAHIQCLRGEIQSLMSHLQARSPDSAPLLMDLERLTHRNGELCSTLAATQHSRTLLEREVLALKRNLHTQQCETSSCRAQCQSLKDENERIMEENTELKTLSSSLSQGLREENQRLIEENTRLKMQSQQDKIQKGKEIERCKLEVEQLRRSQLEEIDVRCREVDCLKDQLSCQLGALQEESEELNQQVADLSAEREGLLDKIRQLEAEVQEKGRGSSSAEARLEHEKQQLEDHLHNMKQLIQDMSAENTSLTAQIRRLEKECDELRESRDSLGKSVEEKTAIVTSARTQLDSLSATQASYKTQIEKMSKELKEVKGQLRCQGDLISELKLLASQRASRIQHLEKLLHRRTQLNGTKRGLEGLSNGHHSNLQLELTQLRTSHAKLSGSYHAVVAVRDKLKDDHAHLASRNKELEGKMKVLLADKQFLLTKLEELSSECLHLANSEGAAKEELVHVSEGRERDRLEMAREMETLQLNNEQLQATANQVHELQGELCMLEGVVDQEVEHMLAVASECERNVQHNKHLIQDITEEERLCSRGNEARLADVEACEGNVAVLQGELEFLQARKSAIISVTPALVSMTTDPPNSSGASKSLEGCLSSHGNLKRKLKMLKKRNDFLRVRLGCALAELRVYQRQKVFTDQQLSHMQDGLDCVRKQYGLCTQHLDHLQQHM